MSDQSQPPQSSEAPKAQAGQSASLKAVAIDLFKKSQRLPPLSLILKKKRDKNLGDDLSTPPHGFEFADFYHL